MIMITMIDNMLMLTIARRKHYRILHIMICIDCSICITRIALLIVTIHVTEIAVIKPIFKKNGLDKNNLNNYRSICQLPVFFYITRTGCIAVNYKTYRKA